MGSRSSGWGFGDVKRGQVGTFSDPRWPVIREWLEWIGTGIIFVSIGIVLAGLADRAPPFKVVEAVVPAGTPGSKITMEARVWRDAGRGCSATMYRSIFHSNGVRVDLPMQFFAPEDIKKMERHNPGVMKPQIEIPKDAEPGKDAYMSTRLRYVCNAYQALLPIDVNVVQPFAVIAP